MRSGRVHRGRPRVRRWLPRGWCAAAPGPRVEIPDARACRRVWRTRASQTGGRTPPFAAYAGQAGQQVHGALAAHAAKIGETNATVSISECAQHGLNPVRLDNAQTAGADGVDQLVNGCVAHGLPAAEGPR